MKHSGSILVTNEVSVLAVRSWEARNCLERRKSPPFVRLTQKTYEKSHTSGIMSEIEQHKGMGAQ